MANQYTHSPVTVEQRFWSKVNRNTDGCWEWSGGSFNGVGYGLFWMNRKNRLAHRVAYELTHGTIPVKLNVCHTCNNVRCVRPEHLYLDTQKGNIEYQIALGRKATGERSPNAKLTDADVRLIRSTYRHERGVVKALSKQFGVDRHIITGIIKRRAWKHVE